MSTFDGKVAEFPDIRIDYFRPTTVIEKPPLAFLLSHVHSDHLTGLEACKSPFIYCSAGTREVLLRLEKRNHRFNFNSGILEARKQTYRHLKTLLRAIPLETPTELELAPGKRIRVTLFDANHCVGAVMFLVEGDGKAVLYTGDIRSETWWVNSLLRNPILSPYSATAGIKHLDSIYMDSTFVAGGKVDSCKIFPSKADGLLELLGKVSKYPKGTLFYFDAWTFGYEDVYSALSHFLDEPIHVDGYRWGIYLALANGAGPKAPEATKLMGFYCGNQYQRGCLTPQPSLIHSCEQRSGCDVWDRDYVRITPIISRHNGAEMQEAGAGGGRGDLNQQHELDMRDTGLLEQLHELLTSLIAGQPKGLPGIQEMVTAMTNVRTGSLPMENFNKVMKKCSQGDDGADPDALSIDEFIPAFAKMMAHMKQKGGPLDAEHPQASPTTRADGLPKQITFPYSRHSSYSELCEFIQAFKPNEIVPCTVSEKKWTPANSMSFLFGHIYGSQKSFRHDQQMLAEYNERRAAAPQPLQNEDVARDAMTSSSSVPSVELDQKVSDIETSGRVNASAAKTPSEKLSAPSERTEKSSIIEQSRQRRASIEMMPPPFRPSISDSKESRNRLASRANAEEAALGAGGASWADIQLFSTRSPEASEEEL